MLQIRCDPTLLYKLSNLFLYHVGLKKRFRAILSNRDFLLLNNRSAIGTPHTNDREELKRDVEDTN